MKERTTFVRVGIALAGYALGVLLILPLLQTVERVLFLPPLFERLAYGALVVGVPIAVALAWRYPDMGDGSD